VGIWGAEKGRKKGSKAGEKRIQNRGQARTKNRGKMYLYQQQVGKEDGVMFTMQDLDNKARGTVRKI